MLISVIIPVYNAAHSLSACIASVIASCKKVTDEYEIICINDGSTDASASLLEEWKTREVRLTVVHQKNQGAAAAEALLSQAFSCSGNY